MQNSIYLSLGSNLGNREERLHQAISKLATLGDVTRVSSFYETEPVEKTDQPWFINCVVELKTEHETKRLMDEILEIEKTMGRTRSHDKGPRNIDIDILLAGDAVITKPGLVIPHPAMQKRRFILEPLFEIAPELYHPVLKRTIRELRDALPAGQAVRKVQ